MPLVKAAAMVERNGRDYAVYLGRVFQDDPNFRQAADNWAEEEVQHGDALAKWATLADPAWDSAAAFDRYRAGYHIKTDADASIRGSRTGELIARCMVETGTSSYYTAMAEATTDLSARACSCAARISGFFRRASSTRSESRTGAGGCGAGARERQKRT